MKCGNHSWIRNIVLGSVLAFNLTSVFADDDDDKYYQHSYSYSTYTTSVTPLSVNLENSLALLIPDGQDQMDPRVQAWKDAAEEAGLPLFFLRTSDFLALGDNASTSIKGLVIPDQIYTVMPDNVVDAIKQFVNKGGELMLVYDAGALYEVNGIPFYPDPRSRFSDMVGVDYVLYSKYLGETIGLGPVLGREKTLWSLNVPPGKSMPFAETGNDWPTYLISNEYNPGGLEFYDKQGTGTFYGDFVDHSDVELDDKYGAYSDTTYDSVPTPVSPSQDIYGISGYVYGFLTYPSFVTEGEYPGKALMASADFGLVAGVNNYGSGRVLFVNLPLSYLKGQTDGMLMHGFLQYFGVEILRMPYLSAQPNGKGGMVLNWHVDYAGALEPMMALGYMGVWNQGPFSIHITAGPDTIVPGDGLGLDVPHNEEIQSWIRYFVYKGHQVASHGGWIHDYYGLNANETNEDEFLPYLVMNNAAIEKYTGKKSTEYSAPQGNNPSWAMNWLEEQGILGYYFTGHTGMGPTRTYREGSLKYPSMWAFPVSTLGQFATFEEFDEYAVDPAEVTRWLSALMDFSVYNRTSRLIYFHPPGAVDFPAVVKNLLNRANAYKSDNLFKWYTMTELSRFLSTRQDVSWSVTQGWSNYQRFELRHPSSLRQQTFMLPKTRFAKPSINEGDAYVKDGGDAWMVVARSGTKLKFTSWTYN